MPFNKNRINTKSSKDMKRHYAINCHHAFVPATWNPTFS